MIKLPLILETAQKQIDVGINAFAAELLAESFADDPNRFKDKNLMLVRHSHKGTPVFIILTKTQPKMEDFETLPEIEVGVGSDTDPAANIDTSLADFVQEGIKA